MLPVAAEEVVVAAQVATARRPPAAANRPRPRRQRQPRQHPYARPQEAIQQQPLVEPAAADAVPAVPIEDDNVALQQPASPPQRPIENIAVEEDPRVRFYRGPDLTNYRFQEVRCDLGQYTTCPPAMFVEQQRREFEEDVLQREAVVLYEEQPNLMMCNLCLTNVATRMASPCAHWIGCIDCVVALIEARNFYQIVADLDDETGASTSKMPPV